MNSHAVLVHFREFISPSIPRSRRWTTRFGLSCSVIADVVLRLRVDVVRDIGGRSGAAGAGFNPPRNAAPQRGHALRRRDGRRFSWAAGIGVGSPGSCLSDAVEVPREAAAGHFVPEGVLPTLLHRRPPTGAAAARQACARGHAPRLTSAPSNFGASQSRRIVAAVSTAATAPRRCNSPTN